MAHNRYVETEPTGIDDAKLAKALTMMVDEYGTQNYGCAWCSHVRDETPHTAECPITIATAAIKILKTRKLVVA